MPFVSKTPKPPYFAVVFTSVNADVDHTEHTAMYGRMLELAQTYDGFLGIEPARNPDGTGVAVVYWRDRESITAFARDHRASDTVPRSVDFIGELPRTGSGKILKRQLRAPYWAGRTAQVG